MCRDTWQVASSSIDPLRIKLLYQRVFHHSPYVICFKILYVQFAMPSTPLLICRMVISYWKMRTQITDYLRIFWILQKESVTPSFLRLLTHSCIVTWKLHSSTYFLSSLKCPGISTKYFKSYKVYFRANEFQRWLSLNTIAII